MRGGKRIGAGRKKGFAAKSAEEARRVLCEMVIREINPIGEALIARAKKGEMSAIKELFDRTWGRPKQEVTLNNKEESVGSYFDPNIKALTIEYEKKLKEILTQKPLSLK